MRKMKSKMPMDFGKARSMICVVFLESKTRSQIFISNHSSCKPELLKKQLRCNINRTLIGLIEIIFKRLSSGSLLTTIIVPSHPVGWKKLTGEQEFLMKFVCLAGIRRRAHRRSRPAWTMQLQPTPVSVCILFSWNRYTPGRHTGKTVELKK